MQTALGSWLCLLALLPCSVPWGSATGDLGLARSSWCRAGQGRDVPRQVGAVSLARALSKDKPWLFPELLSVQVTAYFFPDCCLSLRADGSTESASPCSVDHSASHIPLGWGRARKVVWHAWGWHLLIKPRGCHLLRPLGLLS